MDEQQAKRARTMIGWICDQVTPGAASKTIYEVHLSTGTTLEGELSPFDDQSDHIRLNVPSANGRGSGSSYAIQLAHIVYVHEKQPS